MRLPTQVERKGILFPQFEDNPLNVDCKLPVSLFEQIRIHRIQPGFETMKSISLNGFTIEIIEQGPKRLFGPGTRNLKVDEIDKLCQLILKGTVFAYIK